MGLEKGILNCGYILTLVDVFVHAADYDLNLVCKS